MWDVGNFGKTNKVKSGGGIHIFSDSMLRPLVEGDIDVPFYVNSTPGGRYFHIEQEIVASKEKISVLLLFCGTNDLSMGLNRGEEQFKKLLCTAKKNHPLAEVSFYF